MFGPRAVALGALLSCGACAACGRTEASTSASRGAAGSGSPAVSSAGVSAAAAVSSAASSMSADGGEGADWPAMVREERWEAAARALESLPDPEKARPELRYARARVAFALEKYALALQLLDGLEGDLPLLAEDIGRWRAEAQLAVGPFAEAGEWFASHPGAALQLDAARAFEKAGDARRARGAADRVVAAPRHSRAQEAEARALRVRVVEPPGDPERADARWLATRGADVAPVDAMALLARLDPRRPLTAEELLVRARTLSDAGRTDDALKAIEAAAGAPEREKVPELDRARARGMVLFRAHGRYGEAAKVLAECAGAGGPHAAEDAFHAARALSRADRDEEAIRGYEGVERRFPKSPWAEAAAFFAPYLRMLHGEWRECAGGFDAYARGHVGGEHERDARRDGGLCKLLSGDAKGARVLFERLIDDERADPVASARAADMAALAALRDGDRTHAVALWTDVARSRALTWPALVARARLVEAAAPLPPVFDPAPDPADPAPPLGVAIPPPADMLHRIGLEEDAERELIERESAIVAGTGSRQSEALCQGYGELARARRRYQIGQTLPLRLFSAAPSARTRWAWDCAYPAPYADAVKAAESRDALPVGLVWGIMRQESAFDPDAVSPARAVGLMQLLPDTARSVAEGVSLSPDELRLTNPRHAISVGARVLRGLLDRFHGDLPLAVAGYNAGAEPLERWLSRAPGMQLDTFVERIPFDETRDYVSKVMSNVARYAYLARGDAAVPAITLELPGR